MKKIISFFLITTFSICSAEISTNLNEISPKEKKDYLELMSPLFQESQFTWLSFSIYFRVNNLVNGKNNFNLTPTFFVEPLTFQSRSFYFAYTGYSRYETYTNKAARIFEFNNFNDLKVLKSLDVELPLWTMYPPQIEAVTHATTNYLRLLFLDRHVMDFLYTDTDMSSYALVRLIDDRKPYVFTNNTLVSDQTWIPFAQADAKRFETDFKKKNSMQIKK